MLSGRAEIRDIGPFKDFKAEELMKENFTSMVTEMAKNPEALTRFQEKELQIIPIV